MTKNCVICNQEFCPKSKFHKTCSIECSFELRRLTNKRNYEKTIEIKCCAHCGFEFLPSKYGNKLCSIECRKARAELQRIDRDARNKPISIKICTNCNNEFITDNFNNKTCSKQCKIERNRTIAKETHKIKRAKALAKPDRLLNCVTCGSSFVAYASKQKNCSPECSLQYKLQHNRKKGIERNRAIGDRVTSRGPVFNWLSLYKLIHGCVDCGYNKNFSVLQFDHVREEKLFALSMGKFQAIEHFQAILDEVAKCEVRCANCHAERHSKIGWSGNVEDFKDLDIMLRKSLDSNTANELG